MGQFKPMTKMLTTEPSVMLKLKKGGHVSMKAGGKSESGHKPMHKMDGGVMRALASTPALVGRPAVQTPVRVPARPSMAARRAAMRMNPPVMKKGGKAEGGDLAQDKAMIKKAIKQHDEQEHKGGKGTKLKLKTGGVAMGAGGYAKGGIIKSEKGVGPYDTTLMHEAKPDHSPAKTEAVKMGNGGGYKKGGKVRHKAKGGAMSYVDGNVTGTPPGKTNTETGAVKKSNAGGYKKGGSAKKAYATGGLVDTGKPVAMPQGHKKPSSPVEITRLSGTFKKGGAIKKEVGGLMAPASKSATIQREKVTTTAPSEAERRQLMDQVEQERLDRAYNDFKRQTLPDQMRKILPRKKGGRAC